MSAKNFDGLYLYSTLERYKPESEGYKRHFTILKNQSIWFTTCNKEQQKIGNFFKELDELITLHQRKSKNEIFFNLFYYLGIEWRNLSK
ncbi:restriction endonuclease S subunit [Enterococcus sp. PF1-24]|nr:restriction endonuclease S subunit [Enterococcus sp. PFB1-1]MDH6401160.1 restriction endonuclease S subunit [Enterococcus sp. PF1-24]